VLSTGARDHAAVKGQSSAERSVNFAITILNFNILALRVVQRVEKTLFGGNDKMRREKDCKCRNKHVKSDKGRVIWLTKHKLLRPK
jgi:hypothetical protein